MTAMPLALSATLETVGLPAVVRKKSNLLGELFKEIKAAPFGHKMAAYEAGRAADHGGGLRDDGRWRARRLCGSFSATAGAAPSTAASPASTPRDGRARMPGCPPPSCRK